MQVSGWRSSTTPRSQLACKVWRRASRSLRAAAAQVRPAFRATTDFNTPEMKLILASHLSPGWLLRMASNERSMEEFQTVHNSILVQLRVRSCLLRPVRNSILCTNPQSYKTIQAEKVDTLPNGRQLTYGEYRDATRSLRRCLRQLGSGSLEDGLQAVNDDDKALTEVAQLIHVDKQVCWPAELLPV